MSIILFSVEFWVRVAPRDGSEGPFVNRRLMLTPRTGPAMCITSKAILIDSNQEIETADNVSVSKCMSAQ
jgi:hypothetical protein